MPLPADEGREPVNGSRDHAQCAVGGALRPHAAAGRDHQGTRLPDLGQNAVRVGNRLAISDGSNSGTKPERRVRVKMTLNRPSHGYI